MEMILYIVGLLTAIYLFARKVVVNEPFKTNINNVFNKTNAFISLQKDKNTSLVLIQISNLAKKVMLFSIIMLLILSFLPFKIYSILTLYVNPIFLVSILLYFSITWIQNHTKSAKEYLCNYQTVFLMFFPVIIFLLDKYFQTDFMHIFNPIKLKFKDFNFIYFQLIWAGGIFLLLYLGAFFISIPIYLLIYSVIILTAFGLKKIERYINTHLLDVIVGLIGIIVAYLKIFTCKI